MRNDVFFADHARSRHSQRFENSVAQEVAIELSTDFVNEDSQCDISEVAITPFLTWLKSERDKFDSLEHFTLGVVATKIKVRRVIGHAAGVSEQVAHGNLLPRCRHTRNVFRDRIVETELSL